ncbi:DUF5057 domain-containing protein [Paenibacillus sp. FSL P2-0089]|uniref:DUF5057 domain-containing protein n=1 Tax=Paenibacillus sp. FSL P2-0089 TaxID=2954526 RepID=UPI003159FC15
MEVLKRKRLLLMLSLPLTLILFAVIWSMVSRIDADQNSYPVRLLEVTEDGSSQLTSLKTEFPDFTVVTMSMKRFVALRDDLDGQYDGIFIGKGTYSPVTLGNLKDKDVSVRSAAMNTSLIQNDITRLRVDDINKLFIMKGLYVIFHEQTFLDQEKAEARKGILYEAFNPLRRTSASKSNVLFLNDSGLNDFFKGLKADSSKLKQRPQLQITNSDEISNYVPASTGGKIYAPGDKLKFNFNVSNTPDLANHPLTAKLYINLDKSIAMSEQQVVTSVKVNKANGTLEYILPRTFSGLLYWKLEISDPTSFSQLKSYERGSIRYRNEKTVIRVLQITPPGSSTSPIHESSLKKSINMNQGFLSNEDYKLDITVMNIDEFNYYIESTLANTHEYGLNGVYDMLLFGFRDEYYSKTIMKPLSITAVKEFINESKQSAMFTHDTVINLYGSNTWVNNFKEITGQKDPVVNLGHNALNPSKKVTPVNDGLLMQYPFYLSQQTSSGTQNSIGEPKVAKTHNQYFTLDLEDRTVIPWYNIISESGDANKRTPDDSWNHYYTYSKGNVTYSGTGHLFGSNLSSSESVFPEWEQKLFVNTMYRAFMGANHAPSITAYSPIEGAVIPSYQDKLTVSYLVADLDLKDRTLTTNLKFIVNGTELTSPDYMIHNRRVGSEETITQTFKNPLSESGNIEIMITAQDDQGASASPVIIPLTVSKVESTLSIGRSQSATKIGRDKRVTIDYSIAPKTLRLEDVQPQYQGKNNLLISGLHYEEKFAPNLEFEGEALPQGFTKTGSLSEGYTIKGTFENITFQLTTIDGKQYYKPVNPNSTSDPLIYKFTLSFKPKAAVKYILDNSSITYDDIHAPAESVPTAAPTAAPTVAATPIPTPTPTPTPVPTVAPPVFPGSTAPISALGVAKDYTVFMLKDIRYDNNSFQNKGRTAAGRNVKAQSFTLGDTLTDAVLVVGNDLYWGSWGGKISGKGYYGNNIEMHAYLSQEERANITKGSPLDFTTIGSQLIGRSAYMGSLTGKEIKVSEDSDLVVSGEDKKLNIFNVKPSNLNNINLRSLKINAPADSTVLINIAGESIKFINGSVSVNGVSSNHIILNFYQAKSLTVESYGEINQSILAPLANINLTGSFNGNIIGESLLTIGSSGIAIGYQPFEGSLPEMPAATTAPTAVPTATPTPVATATATPVPTASASPTVMPTATPVPTTVTMKFLAVNLEVIIEITSIAVHDENILVDQELSLPSITTILPDDVDAKDRTLLWTIVSGKDFIKFTSDGIIQGIAPGEAEIQASAQDGSKVVSNIARITVTAPIPPEPIRTIELTGDISGTANTPINLNAVYTSNPVETDINYKWTATDGNGTNVNQYLTTSGPTSPTGTFNAPQSGIYTITVTAYSNSNKAGSPATKIITITNPLRDFTIDSADSVFVGKFIEMSVKDFAPNNADDALDIHWSLVGDGAQYASLTKAPDDTNDTKYIFTGIKAKDTVTVSVTAGGITRTKRIKIEPLVLTDIQFTGTIVEMNVGDSRPLDQLLWFSPREITLNDVRDQLDWTSTFSGIASFQTPVTADNRGIIHAHKSGSTLVTVQYVNNPLIKTTILVKVYPLDTDDRY